MANYTETFSGQTTGSNSTTFTNRWASETSISVETPALDEQDDRVLQFGTGDTGRQLQSMDAIDADGNRANCEMLARVWHASDDDNQAWIIGRASGAGTTETGYIMLLRSTGSLGIFRANSGSLTQITPDGPNLDGPACPWRWWFRDNYTFVPTGAWLWFRFRINGTGATVTLSAKIWADGQEEPTDWTLQVTDTDASRITAAGWCGFGRSVHTGNVYLDMFAAASNGDTAVAAASTTPVRVTAADAQVLLQDNTTPVRATAVDAQVLAQNEATPIRVTAVDAQVLYTRIPDRIGAPQTVIATIGTGNN